MKVKLKKAFEHHGRKYQEGDEYEGLAEEISILAKQGYCDEPEEESEEKPAAKPAHPSVAPEPPKKTVR
jgi:hypothetical protein